MKIHYQCKNASNIQGVFFNWSAQFSVPKWKKLAQPTRSFFTLKISWKTSPGWLQLVFHFGTENRADQLKKTTPYIYEFDFLIDLFQQGGEFHHLGVWRPPWSISSNKNIYTTQNLLSQVASELDRLHVAGSDLGPALLVRPHQLHPCLGHAA